MEFALYLIAGFVILIIAGDVLVRGAVSLAERFGIPSIVIGLTIVAFGTSAPELVISLKAALTGHGEISTALIKAIPCGGAGSVRNGVFMVVVTVVFIICFWFQPFTYVHGLILLALLVVFLAG